MTATLENLFLEITPSTFARSGRGSFLPLRAYWLLIAAEKGNYSYQQQAKGKNTGKCIPGNHNITPLKGYRPLRSTVRKTVCSNSTVILSYKQMFYKRIFYLMRIFYHFFQKPNDASLLSLQEVCPKSGHTVLFFCSMV